MDQYQSIWRYNLHMKKQQLTGPFPAVGNVASTTPKWGTYCLHHTLSRMLVRMITGFLHLLLFSWLTRILVAQESTAKGPNKQFAKTEKCSLSSFRWGSSFTAQTSCDGFFMKQQHLYRCPIAYLQLQSLTRLVATQSKTMASFGTPFLHLYAWAIEQRLSNKNNYYSRLLH